MVEVSRIFYMFTMLYIIFDVVYLDQLLDAAHLIHFISNHDTYKIRKVILVPVFDLLDHRV